MSKAKGRGQLTWLLPGTSTEGFWEVHVRISPEVYAPNRARYRAQTFPVSRKGDEREEHCVCQALGFAQKDTSRAMTELRTSRARTV